MNENHNNNKKLRLFDLVALLLLAILFAISAFLTYQNEELKLIIQEQNDYLESVIKKDSISNEKSNLLKDSISNYTKVLNAAFGKGNIDPNLFLDAYKNLEDERDSLKSVYDFAKETYGFKISYKKKITEDKNTIYTNTIVEAEKFTPADSASILLLYFRDKMKYDKNKKVWSIYK